MLLVLLKSGHRSILLFITVKNNGAPQSYDKNACKFIAYDCWGRIFLLSGLPLKFVGG